MAGPVEGGRVIRLALSTHSAVIARLDRAIQYAAASPYPTTVSGILDPRFRGDDSGNCLSLSDTNELN
ncbi:hypothetical protein EAS56_21075 [Bradyrhizobium guangzhouense]|uniref:Uncharacterized protein n=1 Tax=Bradyrhizobium guangzhouense TaxID=1325095 RepID=A0AAE5WYI9_9BRAD|nr:hypothetical protein XH91_08835 [Bradyrhizobium guangzhouense]RXH10940.1 hypothetical protein EAS56_21075 [Bradyrhizobium guangzhouense]